MKRVGDGVLRVGFESDSPEQSAHLLDPGRESKTSLDLRPIGKAARAEIENESTLDRYNNQRIMALYRACHWICRGRTSLSLSGAGLSGCGFRRDRFVGRIGIGFPGKQFAAEGGYGDAGDDGDPDGEEEPSGVEEKCVGRHENFSVTGLR